MLKLTAAAWALGNVAIFGQLATEGGITTDWLTAGSQAVVTGLLLLTWKGLFIDQRWVPAKDASHDEEVRHTLGRIADHLGVGRGRDPQ